MYMVLSVDMANIVKSARNSFYFYVLAALGSRGTAANRQLFYLSLVMRHKGLSRSGLQVLSGMNLGLPLRSFEPELLVHEQECMQNRRSRRAGAPTLIYELLFKTPRDIRENETPYLDPFFDGESEFAT